MPASPLVLLLFFVLGLAAVGAAYQWRLAETRAFKIVHARTQWLLNDAIDGPPRIGLSGRVHEEIRFSKIVVVFFLTTMLVFIGHVATFFAGILLGLFLVDRRVYSELVDKPVVAARYLWSLVSKRLLQKPETPQEAFERATVKLCAMIAATDGEADGREFSAMKHHFTFDALSDDEVSNIFMTQVAAPERLRTILPPLRASFGQAGTVYQTLVLGLCQLALADGVVHPREEALIRMTAGALGVKPMTVNRLLASAGFSDANRGGAHHEQAKNRTDSHASLSERAQHLAVLGLKEPATVKQIRSAYRRLAKTYHPDRLASQNLPPQEFARAEALMMDINAAHDWLLSQSQ